MKWLAVLLLLSCSALAQFPRYDGVVLPSGTPNGPANVAVCQAGGAGGPPCTPLAVVYSDANGNGQIKQPFSADINGHFYFYAPVGTYVTDTYGAGYTTTLTTITLSVSTTDLLVLTPGVIPQANTPTSLANSSPLLDNGNTGPNTLTYAGTGGITASAGPIQTQNASCPSCPGYLALNGNTVNPTIVPASAGWLGPSTNSFTAYAMQLPNTPPSGTQFMSCGTPVSGVSTCSFGSGTGASLSALTAATGTNTLANGNNPQTWNWAQTTASQTAFTFGETTTPTTAGNGALGVTTLTGTTPSIPLVITQGSNTGTTSTPAVSIVSTTNNASLTNNLFKIALTNTASNSASTLFQALAGTTASALEFQTDVNGNTSAAGAYNTTTQSGNTNVCGGNTTAASCAANVASAVGGAFLRGGGNASTNAAAKAGPAVISGGILTAAAPVAGELEGIVQMKAGYLKGTAIAAVGGVECGTTTAFTVTDCSHTGPATNIVGIADSTANPIGIVSYGIAVVLLDGAGTLGDNVCMGTTTDGQAHDNGTAACALGTAIGVIINNSGTLPITSGNTFSGTIVLSTTLVEVQLHIAQ